MTAVLTIVDPDDHDAPPLVESEHPDVPAAWRAARDAVATLNPRARLTGGTPVSATYKDPDGHRVTVTVTRGEDW